MSVSTALNWATLILAIGACCITAFAYLISKHDQTKAEPTPKAHESLR
jgi:cytochrome b561